MLGKMTRVHADKRMNPIHFGIDPADILIRVLINPEIWILIPDQIWPCRSFRSLSAIVFLCCRCDFTTAVVPRFSVVVSVSHSGECIAFARYHLSRFDWHYI